MFGLDVLQLEMLAKLWQVVGKHLLVNLHDLPHKYIVERIERHDRVLRHQVAEGHEALVLSVHEKKQRGSNIRHSLDIADVRSVHGECLQYSLKLNIVNPICLEYSSKFGESSRYVCVNDQDAAFTSSVLVLTFTLFFRLYVN